MRILLIEPPPRVIKKESISVPPLGIAYLAAGLEKKGHSVEIIDGFAEGLDFNALEVRIQQASPDVVGITGMTPVIDSAFRTAEAARKHAKYIVMGGPHVSVVQQKLFEQTKYVDVAVQGEADYSLGLLIDKLESNSDISGVPGVITREFQNASPPPIGDIDTLPFPARHLLPNKKYRYIFSRGSVTTLFTSRGCPYNCVFCDKAVFGSKWRARSADNVLDELELVINNFGIRSVVFYDDLFTVKKERVIQICEGILDRKLMLDWKCEGRVNLVDQDTLKWMKEAGCTMIAYGVESGNQKGLDYLNKGTKVEQIKQAFRDTRKAGIKAMGYFVLGIPVETYDEELHTIDFAKEIQASYAQFSILSPTPGTKLYDDVIRMGWYREVDARNPMDKDIKRPAIINENWNETKLHDILREAHKRFYLRPWYLWQRLKEVRNVRDFVTKARAGLRVLMWYVRS